MGRKEEKEGGREEKREREKEEAKLVRRSLSHLKKKKSIEDLKGFCLYRI